MLLGLKVLRSFLVVVTREFYILRCSDLHSGACGRLENVRKPSDRKVAAKAPLLGDGWTPEGTIEPTFAVQRAGNDPRTKRRKSPAGPRRSPPTAENIPGPPARGL